MRYLILALVTLTMACAPITERLDEATGATLAERCQTRRAAVAAYDTLTMTRPLSAAESQTRTAYQIYIDSVCPALPAGP